MLRKTTRKSIKGKDQDEGSKHEKRRNGAGPHSSPAIAQQQENHWTTAFETEGRAGILLRLPEKYFARVGAQSNSANIGY